MKPIYIIVLILLASACSQRKEYENSSTFEWDDFKFTQKLIGETVQFDTPIMKPIRILVQDSLLITINIGEDSLITLYELNDNTLIGYRIQQGQGPNDMLQPSFADISPDNIQLFDIATSTLYDYPLGDFISSNTPQYSKRIKLKEQIFSDIRFLGNEIISSAHGKKSPFLLFDESGNSAREWGRFPESNKTYTDTEKSEAFLCTFTTNKKDRVAICHSWTDLIEIYDINENLKKRLHGPERFIPYFHETHPGGANMARPEKGKQRDAYYNPVSVGDHFFVLFNGKYLDSPDYSPLSTRILVFNWDGTPERILYLDQGIFTFTVDPKAKAIYGISDNPEFHIVKFTYQ